jgi:hypothetical protein
MNNSKAITLIFLSYLMLAVSGNTTAQFKKGELLISFQHTANGKYLVLTDSIYTTSVNESYKVTRLKYYISNIKLDGDPDGPARSNVILVDAAVEDTFRMPLAPRTYNRLSFTLGVDSLLNCSGAQDGALDPLNGMFWTWNSGYIFFKLEGSSPSSVADLHRIEHHIGGYRGPYMAARHIELNFEKPLVLKENSTQQINIRFNLDRYWHSVNDIKIAETPVIMVPGELAARCADNFKAMFSIISIQ